MHVLNYLIGTLYPSFSSLISSTGMNWRAEYAIAKLNEKHGKQVLISFFIGTDDRDSNAHIIHVGVRNHRLPLFSFAYKHKCMFTLVERTHFSTEKSILSGKIA